MRWLAILLLYSGAAWAQAEPEAESEPNSEAEEGPGGYRVPEAPADEANKIDKTDQADPPEPVASSGYRNPQGAIVLNLVLGLSTGQSTRFVAGGQVGYAVLTGVVPGVRGLVIGGSDNISTGGEVAATLTLTPPLVLSVVPFVVGEVGRRIQGDFSGWLYGGGGGLFFGKPTNRVSFQLGWIFRRLVVQGRNFDVSAPIIGVSVRF